MTRVKSFFEWPMSRDGIVTSRRHIGRTSCLHLISASFFCWLALLELVAKRQIFLWLWGTATLALCAHWGIPFHSIPFRCTFHFWDSANCILLTAWPWFSSSSFLRSSILLGQKQPVGCIRPRSCVNLWPGAAAEDFINGVLLSCDFLTKFIIFVSAKLVFLS